MPDNLVFNDHDGIAKGWRESVYTEPCLKDSLSAEILNVAKLRVSLSTKCQAAFITTTFPSKLSGVPDGCVEQSLQSIQFLEKWGVDEWIQPSKLTSGYQLESPSHVNSEPISRKSKKSIAGLITTVVTSTDLSMSDRLAPRLEYLVAISEEEFPEQEPMSSGSLDDFLTMIRSIPHIAYPDVVLTYEGNIRAEWTKARNQHFAVEFLGDSQVRFVVFAPDPQKQYKTNMCSGISTLDSLMDLVRPHGVFDWIVDPIQTAA